uniref:NopRA1 domain-containing protein n=1 Tax=Ascaris lumbricoides TaxID=6252 RepID=A0A0M3IHH7_ASCLU
LLFAVTGRPSFRYCSRDHQAIDWSWSHKKSCGKCDEEKSKADSQPIDGQQADVTADETQISLQKAHDEGIWATPKRSIPANAFVFGEYAIEMGTEYLPRSLGGKDSESESDDEEVSEQQMDEYRQYLKKHHEMSKIPSNDLEEVENTIQRDAAFSRFNKTEGDVRVPVTSCEELLDGNVTMKYSGLICLLSLGEFWILKLALFFVSCGRSICRLGARNQTLNPKDLSWIASNLKVALNVETAIKKPLVNGRYLEPVIARFRSLSSAVERSSNSNPLDAQRMRFLARSSIETLLFSLSSNPVNFQPPMQAIRCVVLWSKSADMMRYRDVRDALFCLLDRLLQLFPPRSHATRLYWLYAFADVNYTMHVDENENLRRLIEKFRSRVFSAFSVDEEEDVRRFLVELFEWDLCSILLGERIDGPGRLCRYPLCLLLHFDIDRMMRFQFSRDSVRFLVHCIERAISTEQSETRRIYIRLVEISVEALRLAQSGFCLEPILKAEVPSLTYDRVMDVQMLTRAALEKGLTSVEVKKLFTVRWMRDVAANTIGH